MNIISFINGIVVGVAVSAVAYYIEKLIKTLNRHENMMYELYEKYDSIPSPEEMAKQVLHTKLPVEDLPEDMQQEIFKAASDVLSKQNDEPSIKNKTGYIG